MFNFRSINRMWSVTITKHSYVAGTAQCMSTISRQGAYVQQRETDMHCQPEYSLRSASADAFLRSRSHNLLIMHRGAGPTLSPSPAPLHKVLWKSKLNERLRWWPFIWASPGPWASERRRGICEARRCHVLPHQLQLYSKLSRDREGFLWKGFHTITP